MLNECQYTINIGEGKKTFNIMDLTKYYYKSTSRLTNQNIFSTEEIMDSVILPIKKQLEFADEIRNDDTKKAVRDYITSDQNTDVYSLIGVTQNRLAPEYIEEKRILNTVINHLKDNHSIIVPDNYTIKEVLENFPESKQYYDNVLEEIKIEKETGILGNKIHEVLSNLIKSDGDFTSSLRNGLLEAIIASPILEGDPQIWLSKFENILIDIYKDISSGNKQLLTEVALRSESEALAQVKGKIDIIAVDDSGRVHIYDLKLSRDLYSDWNSAKILETDWQLSFYRALLGQYVHVRDASLNIIPIKLGALNSNGKLDNKNLMLESNHNRLGESTGERLLTTGNFYKVARKLIPDKLELSYDPQRKEDVVSDLKILFPDYNIKTSSAKYDFDILLNDAIKQRGFKSDFAGFTTNNAKHTADGKFYISPKDGTRIKTDDEVREEYKVVIQEYLNYIKETENNNVVQLRQKIMAAIDSNGANITYSNSAQQMIINNIVGQYIHGDYRVVGKSDDLSSLGIILLQNKKYNSYVVLNVTAHNQHANYDNELLFEDIDAIKALVFFNHFTKELDLELNQIEEIVTFNLEGKQVPYKGTDKLFEQYNNLSKRKGLTNKLSRHNFMSVEFKAAIGIRQTQRDIMDNFSDTDPNKKVIKEMINKYGGTIEDLPLYKLKLLQSEFTRAFPELKNKTLASGFNFNDKVEMLFGMIQVLLLIKAEQIPIGDFMGLKNFNIQFSSIKDIFAGLFTSNKDVYDKTEKKIGSIIDGLKTITPDRIGSKDFKNINIMISSANSFIRQAMYKQSTQLAELTKEYYKSINYSTTERNWVGNFRQKSEVFWLKDESGNISSEWRVKNPYMNDTLNIMKTDEQEYLKGILWHINKRRLNITKEEQDKVDISSMDSIKSTTSSSTYNKIIKFMEDGRYFKMALIRSGRIDRNKSFLEGGYSGMVKSLEIKGEELNDYFDSRELDAEDIKQTKQDLGYYEMYNVYEKQSDPFKKAAIAERGVNYYEIDLDTIAHRVTFNQIRKEHVDTILPVINAYVWWMKITSGKANENISKELEYITNRLKQGLFDESIIDEEFADVIKGTSALKSITTAGMLAFRPVLFAKEMIIGMYKGIALASTKIYGGEQFDIKDFTAAVGKLMRIDKQFSTEWNLIDGINNYYGFANRDVNTIYKKLQTNRRGAMLGLGPWMYSMNTIPDYYNRLALFLSKIIHDGCYDAHSLDEKGMLVYDPKKDKRFEHYFQVRDAYTNTNEDSPMTYLPSKTDEVYNKQMRLYNLVTSELNAERIRNGYEAFKEGDIIDKAYSELERASFKSFTDTVYGYYDADSQAEWHKTWYGVLYLQFLQFWPGKMTMWFGTARNEDLSPSGYHRQKKSETGNLIWRKEVLNDDGDIVDFEPTEENTGDPLMEWIGTPQEGLFQSMLKTAKDAATGNWSNIKNEELRTNRALYGMADAMLMMIIFGIISALLKAIIAENGTDGISGDTLKFMDSVNTKVLNESNLWNNTFGALRSQPAFWTYTTKVAGDMVDVAQGDKSIQKALSKDFRAFEFWTPDE